LRDPRARNTVDEFTAEWLRFDSLAAAVKERASFPMYTPELALAMTEEARKLVEFLVWKTATSWSCTRPITPSSALHSQSFITSRRRLKSSAA